jgi:hypothetical protein
VSVLGDGEYQVVSNLLVFRGRLNAIDYELIAGERHDVLVDVDGALKLRGREVLLDHSTLANSNLAIIF